jgi:hypothetical protein
MTQSPLWPSATPQVHIERINRLWNKYLWLKVVNAVNLDVHCYNSLVGYPLHTNNRVRQQWLTLPVGRAYYLCGVTEPYRWEQNTHLMWVPDPDATQPMTVTTPSLSVTMTGLRQVPITDEWLVDIYGGRKAYVTCRNLQAAWLLHRDMGLENQAGRTPRLAQQQATQAGVVRMFD